MSRLIHLCQDHWGAGKATGVPRFSRYFQTAFPDVLNVRPGDLDRVRPRPGDVVVADNHLTLLVPNTVKTIGVHHGCAQTHYDRDPSWRSGWSASLCRQQAEMFDRPNRSWVAPSLWVAAQFSAICRREYKPAIIPHWVPLIERPLRGSVQRPVVTGDWRGVNKGADVIGRIVDALPQFQFKPLNFDAGKDAARERAYQDADVYLCLSLSEGAPYSVADAEATGLPIVTTEVGNCREFKNIYPIDRNDVRGIGEALTTALARRARPSFYSEWTFEKWKEAWTSLIGI